MAGLYICQNGDNIDALCNAGFNPNNKAIADNLKASNPHIKNHHALRNTDALILPGASRVVGSSAQRFLMASTPSSIQNLSKITETVSGRQVLAQQP